MKTIHDIDDPRLTAYALGELEGADAAAVEAFVNASPEARAAVEQIRALAGMLGDELTGEATDDELSLDDERRAALAQAVSEASVSSGVTDATIDATAGAPIDTATSPASPASRQPTLLIRLRPFLSVAAVLLVTLLLVDGYLNRGKLDSDTPVTASEERLSNGFARSTPASDLGKQAVFGDKRNKTAKAPGEGDLEALRQLGYSRGTSRSGGSGAAGDSEAKLDQVMFEQLQQLGYLGESDGFSSGYAGGAAQAEVEFEADLAKVLNRAAVAVDNSSSATLAGQMPSVPVSSQPDSGEVWEEPSIPQAPVLTHESVGVVSPAAKGVSLGRLTGRGRGKVAASTKESLLAMDAEQIVALQALGYLADNDDRARTTRAERRSRPVVSPRGGERYVPIVENPFVPLTSDPLSALSTFGIDVDTASYANMRRFLHRNQLPPANAVRIEELVNYFGYDDPIPEGDVPFAATVDVASCPWEPRHRLVRLALVGERISAEERAATQLVFLLDVSGSMSNADKLPLLIKSFELLLQDMNAEDKVAIVTYASGTKLVLPPTSCAEKQTILGALHGLQAAGSTHASAGIQMAYEVASQGFIEGGNNRILLATDGDFNVGVTSDGGLHDLIRAKAASGVFLTVLGFGTGNLNDATAELLADNGNGNYAYIDSLTEAHKVLVAERDATLVTIAKDVKVQVEFNPGRVAAYRLIGYENRALAAADFRNDKKDAGEIGAGHSVVALYEIVPRGVEGVTGTVELKYQQLPEPATFVDSPELLTVNLRWKRPHEDVGRELAVPVVDSGKAFAETSEEFRFSSAVAALGMLLRGSGHAGDATLAWVVETADAARSFDPLGDRSEFVRLVRTAQGLMVR